MKGWDLSELEGLRYGCIEGCGFCCTFTPEVATAELARLRTRFPRLDVVRYGPPDTGKVPLESGVRLAFQGGCGACTLLSRRACTAYEERPAHCRYFPFHLYFGRRLQACVNRSCRGVEEGPGNLEGQFATDVVAVAPPAALLEHERRAQRAHHDFERHARAGGAWGDVDAEAAFLLDHADRLAELATREATAEAFAPYQARDVVERPFYLDPQLRWFTFSWDGSLLPQTMEENGALTPHGSPLAPRLAPLSPLHVAELRRLAARDCFAGQVYDLVDASEYELGVPGAVQERLVGMACDLRVASALLEDLGTPRARLADELRRFYDTRFLDAPTIGGWL
ncbi:MAG: YkgJ family cysteine cluster protein [Thermoplasmatota archaeon]